ncbi:MAG: hypothetical protein ACI4ES_12540 [Roseburia sp.]
MSVCVISFSSRKDGNCWYQCFTKDGKCPWIDDKEYELLDEIIKSELTYFILPNYCDYPCANFFIFNERSQCYFQKQQELADVYERIPKKVIVVSNTNEENFRTALSSHSKEEPEILFLPAMKYHKISINGDLMTSEQAVGDVKKFVLGESC